MQNPTIITLIKYFTNRDSLRHLVTILGTNTEIILRSKEFCHLSQQPYDPYVTRNHFFY